MEETVNDQQAQAETEAPIMDALETPKGKQAKGGQKHSGGTPPELRLPSLDSIVFKYARSRNWTPDTDKQGRPTGLFRKAYANLTFTFHGLILTRTIWAERFKDRTNNKWKERLSLSMTDRYNIKDLASESIEKAWNRWCAEVLRDGGPLSQFELAQRELAESESDGGFDDKPRLVRDVAEADIAELESLSK